MTTDESIVGDVECEEAEEEEYVDPTWANLTYWERWWRVVASIGATIAAVAVIAAICLGALAAWQGYERGREKRDAQNQTAIEREHIMQDALRQYREGR